MDLPITFTPPPPRHELTAMLTSQSAITGRHRSGFLLRTRPEDSQGPQELRTESKREQVLPGRAERSCRNSEHPAAIRLVSFRSASGPQIGLVHYQQETQHRAFIGSLSGWKFSQ